MTEVKDRQALETRVADLERQVERLLLAVTTVARVINDQTEAARRG